MEIEVPDRYPFEPPKVWCHHFFYLTYVVGNWGSAFIVSWISYLCHCWEQIRFITPIYHPNIDSGGRICLDTLNMPPKGDWKPGLKHAVRML